MSKSVVLLALGTVFGALTTSASADVSRVWDGTASSPMVVAAAQADGTQKANLASLKTDLQALKADSTVSEAEKQAVKDDLEKILTSGATRPSKESVEKLASDLSSAAADGEISVDEMMSVATSLSDVLSSANISEEDAKALASSTKTALQSSGVSKDDLQVILNDVKAIADTAKSRSAAHKSH